MATPEDDPRRGSDTDSGFDLEQGIFSHLIELRARLVKAIVGVVIVFIGLIPVANHVYAWLAEPLVARLPHGAHLIATQVASPFLTPLKLVFYVALFVNIPLIVYQLWAFVSPGLYRHEKRLARPLLVASILLFYGGCAFAYFLVLPAAFHFLTAVTPHGVEMMTDITHYLDFVSLVLFGFGLSFEIPVVEVILAAVGLVNVKKLKSWWRYVVIVAAVVAAAITPPDVTSMLLLMIPMVALYGVGILAVHFMVKPKAGADAAGQAP